DIKRFIIRRGLKIWPSFYLYLAFIAVAAAYFSYPPHEVTHPSTEPGRTIITHPYISQEEAEAPLWPSLLHIQNYYGIIDANNRPALRIPRGHLWSLAVEEHFYLVLPFILLLGIALEKNPRQRLRIVPIAAVAVICFCTLMRC